MYLWWLSLIAWQSLGKRHHFKTYFLPDQCSSNFRIFNAWQLISKQNPKQSKFSGLKWNTWLLYAGVKVVSSDYIGNSRMGLETAPGNYNHLATTKTVYSLIGWEWLLTVTVKPVAKAPFTQAYRLSQCPPDNHHSPGKSLFCNWLVNGCWRLLACNWLQRSIQCCTESFLAIALGGCHSHR